MKNRDDNIIDFTSFRNNKNIEEDSESLNEPEAVLEDDVEDLDAAPTDFDNETERDGEDYLADEEDSDDLEDEDESEDISYQADTDEASIISFQDKVGYDVDSEEYLAYLDESDIGESDGEDDDEYYDELHYEEDDSNVMTIGEARAIHRKFKLKKYLKNHKKPLAGILGLLIVVAVGIWVIIGVVLKDQNKPDKPLMQKIVLEPTPIITPSEEPEPTGLAVKEENAEKLTYEGKLQAGQLVQFGTYPFGKDGKAEPLTWQVIDTYDTYALIVSQNIIDVMPYSKTGKSSWEESDLRNTLNINFYNQVFTETEKEHIMCFEIDNDDNETYKVDGGHDTSDYVFILSPAEMESYQLEKKAKLTPYAYYKLAESVRAENLRYWLRLPGAKKETGNESGYVSVVSSDGTIQDKGVAAIADNVGIRPALWIKYSK